MSLASLTSAIDTANLWAEAKTIERHQHLKVGGTTDTQLYFILEGCVKIYVMDGEEEHLIRLGYRNNLVTALDSFLAEAPSDLYIQALKKTKVKVLDKAVFMKWIKSSESLREVWEQLLSDLVLQQMERERDLLTANPQERYQRVLARSPQLFQEIPDKHIAAYLRMAPETLSRIKKS